MRLEANDRYHDSKRLIGYAVSLDPVALYNDADTPLPSRLDAVITRTIVDRINEEERSLPTDDAITTVLRAGIRDTHTIIDPYLRKQESYDTALAFIDHPKTTQAIATLALRSEESLTNLIRMTQNNQRGIIRERRTDYLETPPCSPASLGGCPAAALERSGAVNPLFERFVKWSGRLALESLAHHNIAPSLRQTK